MCSPEEHKKLNKTDYLNHVEVYLEAMLTDTMPTDSKGRQEVSPQTDLR